MNGKGASQIAKEEVFQVLKDLKGELIRTKEKSAAFEAQSKRYEDEVAALKESSGQLRAEAEKSKTALTEKRH